MLIEVKQAGAVAEHGRLRQEMRRARRRYAQGHGKPARMYVGVLRRVGQDARGAARQGEPRADYDKVRVLYLKESSIRSTATPCSRSTTPSASRSTSRRHLPRARHPDRHGGFRGRDAGAARQGARRVQVRHGGGPGVLRRARPSSTATTRSPCRRKVVALYREGARVEALKSGETGTVVLDQTPFYAESGGQVGDRGELVGSGGTFAVDDTQKIQRRRVRPPRRAEDRRAQGRRPGRGAGRHRRCARAPCATTRSPTSCTRRCARCSGAHVQQKGSLVDAEKTRFDFSHDKPVTDAGDPQGRGSSSTPRSCRTRRRARRSCRSSEAKKSGAVMLFGEKYGDEVRVLDIGSSREFCGGTHVARTGDIGLFKITSEGGVAAGIRRVEATTGANALALVDSQLQEFQRGRAAGARAAGPGMVEKAVTEPARGEEGRSRRSWRESRSKLAIGPGRRPRLAGGRRQGRQGARRDGGRRGREDAARDPGQAEGPLKSAAIVLGAVNDGKVSLIAGVTADLTAQGEGRRAGQFRRAAGRRQGRRPAGHGAGRRHRRRRSCPGRCSR